MAEGGGEFGNENKALDKKIDNDDIYDDDESVRVPSEEEQEVNTTFPMPNASSTPYHFWEQHEMQIMQEEQSGLPDTSYEETPLLSAQAQAQRSWDALTRIFS